MCKLVEQSAWARARAIARTEIAHPRGKAVAHDEVDQRGEDGAADAGDARPALPKLPALKTATARSCERAVPLLVVEIAPTAERAHVAFAFVARNPFGRREAALVIEAPVHLRVLVNDGVVLDGVPRAGL